jgi:hypothetical protein
MRWLWPTRADEALLMGHSLRRAAGTRPAHALLLRYELRESGPLLTDAVTARIVDARTILQRACVSLPEGETRSSLQLALAACGDALDAYKTCPDCGRIAEHDQWCSVK